MNSLLVKLGCGGLTLVYVLASMQWLLLAPSSGGVSELACITGVDDDRGTDLDHPHLDAVTIRLYRQTVYSRPLLPTSVSDRYYVTIKDVGDRRTCRFDLAQARQALLEVASSSGLSQDEQAIVERVLGDRGGNGLGFGSPYTNRRTRYGVIGVHLVGVAAATTLVWSLCRRGGRRAGP